MKFQLDAVLECTSAYCRQDSFPSIASNCSSKMRSWWIVIKLKIIGTCHTRNMCRWWDEIWKQPLRVGIILLPMSLSRFSLLFPCPQSNLGRFTREKSFERAHGDVLLQSRTKTNKETCSLKSFWRIFPIFSRRQAVPTKIAVLLAATKCCYFDSSWFYHALELRFEHLACFWRWNCPPKFPTMSVSNRSWSPGRVSQLCRSHSTTES